MQYVRSISGSVSKTWNSINPATLSGAIDVIVVEHDDGTLACSPFHVRFGKFSLLRPYEKKVEFNVNNVRQDYAMKLGEGGEAFFVFETSANVPVEMQTSPLVSPITSPSSGPASVGESIPELSTELEPLDLESSKGVEKEQDSASPIIVPTRRSATLGPISALSKSFTDMSPANENQSQWNHPSHISARSLDVIRMEESNSRPRGISQPPAPIQSSPSQSPLLGSSRTFHDDQTLQKAPSPSLLPRHQAISRAMTLSKKLSISNIPSHVNDEGDLMLDMTGYKSSEEEALRAEVLARQILSEELEDNDIASLIGADEKGNLWIYSSEEAKVAAGRKAAFQSLSPEAMTSTGALSDPGYHSDDARSAKSVETVGNRPRADSDVSVGSTTPPDSPSLSGTANEPSRSYAKTLRLTSDQLKAMNLKPGANPMSFSVNRAVCTANIFLWQHETPIVISDIDGTITKSDALGHVLNMIGRDWTHLGVAKLYSDIVANGYNILYLTSRSVGQADTTRTYINGINQEGYKLPRGPVIMSPDRTIAALRREIYLRKPEVFKMACLRDIMSLFPGRKSPFYAGFGNRLTDALSYRAVNIPSTRIFTINPNAEVSLDLLSLNGFKTAYTSMRETVPHFFPPVGLLVEEGGEEYTDFSYWRDIPRDIDDMTITESELDDEEDVDDDDEDYPDDGSDVMSDELAESYFSNASLDDVRSGRLQRLPVDESDVDEEEDDREEEGYEGSEQGREVDEISSQLNVRTLHLQDEQGG